jgi:hypothetical protein
MYNREIAEQGRRLAREFVDWFEIRGRLRATVWTQYKYWMSIYHPDEDIWNFNRLALKWEFQKRGYKVVMYAKHVRHVYKIPKHPGLLQ